MTALRDAAAFVLLAVLAAAPLRAAEIEPPAALAKAGAIAFCTELASPPAAYLADEGATPAGFEVDLMKEIGTKLGLRTDVKSYKFATIFAALDSGKCDAVMASTSKSPERLQKYAFVDYVQSKSGMLVKAGNPLNLQTWESLSGHRVAVLLGSANERRLKDANAKLAAAGKPEIDIVSFPTNTVAYQELEIGRVQALASSTMTLAFFVAKSGKKFELGGQPVPPTTFGIMLPKDETAKIQAVQAAMDLMLSDGTVSRVADRWGVSEGIIICTKQQACD